ncbi:MAG TPA: iron-siderophore ABC transporter substrate-binding protein [Coleofasciculaceae cyanobacterium]
MLRANLRFLVSSWVSRAIRLLMLGIFTTLLIVACNSNASNRTTSGDTTNSAVSSHPSNCRIVKHDMGETQVCGQPQKIVALSPHLLDLLLALNRQPAGYAEVFPFHKGKYFDNPSQQIPYLGDRVTSQPINLGNRDEPSLERLIELKPDLILGEVGNNRQVYGILSQIAPTLLWDDRTAKGKWQQSIRQLAQAVGDEKQAEAVIAAYNQRLTAARAELAPIAAAHPNLLLLGANRLSSDLAIVNGDGYLGELLDGLGFQFMSVPLRANIAQVTAVSLELLPQLGAADIIFILGHDLSPDRQNLNSVLDSQTSVIQQEWNDNAIAQTLKASKENRVYFVTYYLWNGFNGPIGAELILNQLRQLLL